MFISSEYWQNALHSAKMSQILEVGMMKHILQLIFLLSGPVLK